MPGVGFGSVRIRPAGDGAVAVSARRWCSAYSKESSDGRPRAFAGVGRVLQLEETTVADCRAGRVPRLIGELEGLGRRDSISAAGSRDTGVATVLQRQRPADSGLLRTPAGIDGWLDSVELGMDSAR